MRWASWRSKALRCGRVGPSEKLLAWVSKKRQIDTSPKRQGHLSTFLSWGKGLRMRNWTERTGLTRAMEKMLGRGSVSKKTEGWDRRLPTDTSTRPPLRESGLWAPVFSECCSFSPSSSEWAIAEDSISLVVSCKKNNIWARGFRGSETTANGRDWLVPSHVSSYC